MCPWLDQHYRYGRIPASLIPRWGPYFEKIGIWSLVGNPHTESTQYGPVYWSDSPMEKRWAHLGDVMQAGWTHIWILGDLNFLSYLATKGVTSDNLPSTMLYGYTFNHTSFIDRQYLDTASYYDFFTTMSNVQAAAITEAARTGPISSKDEFKAIRNINSIPVGVDAATFRPLEVCRREFGREELRVGFFGDKISGADLLVLVTGSKSRRAGLPEAFATIKLLKEKQPHHSIKAYFHMSSLPTDKADINPVDLRTLAAGTDLVVGEDVFFGDSLFDGRDNPLDDTKLNYLYNTSDILLCTTAADGWCFSVVEAMAAGRIVAAPNEHVWLEAIHGGAGIELPTTQFGWAPWNPQQYARTINPEKAADAIAEVMGYPEKMNSIREAARARALQLDWDNIAKQWIYMFGV